MNEVKINIESVVEDLDDAGLVAGSDKTKSEAVGTLTEGDNATVIAYGHLKRVKTLLGLSDTECFGDAEYRMFLETLRSRDSSVFD